MANIVLSDNRDAGQIQVFRRQPAQLEGLKSAIKSGHETNLTISQNFRGLQYGIVVEAEAQQQQQKKH